MARNRHVSFARPDSANVPFSSVYYERSDRGPYEEPQQQQQQQPSASAQDGGPWTSSLQSSSVPRGYPAEGCVPSQHQQHQQHPPAYPQYSSSSSSSSVGRGHHPPSAGWPPRPPVSTASAERLGVLSPPAAGPAQAQGRPSPQGPPMQLMQHAGLAVLNAEQYGDGRGRGGGPAAPRKAPQQAVIEEAAPKKRGRANALPASKAGEPDEDKKRTRGRPRLESTSETPQERRRMQIRLAQRAYRDRKEGAISTLEKEVEDLKAENQKVTQAYQALLARVGGAPDVDPGGVPAKRPPARHDESVASDAPPDEDDAQPAKRARRRPPSTSSSSSPLTAPMQPPGQTVAPPPPPTPLWAGVMVTHEPLMAPSTSHPSAFVGSDLFGGGAVGAPGSYEVLAQATPQNASFAPALAFDPWWPPGGPSTSSSSAWAWAGGPPAPAPAPMSSLPLVPLLPPAAPANFAYQEATFGRRLHRTLLQRAARLAAMAHPPPAALARVFGFAMLFESLDQIRARTLALLAPAERASLFEDRYPFQNLGGAGSHYPPPPPGASSSASSTTPPPSDAAAAAPVDRDPYAMGPMDPRVAKIRDTLVGLGGQIALPGFDGIFWDPEEVDFYLRHNGVVIPPAADHHIVEIPDGAFGPPPAASSSSPSATTATSDADGGSSASGSSSTALTTTTSLHNHPSVLAARPQPKAPPSAGATWSLAADFLDAHYTTASAAPPSDLTYAYDGQSGSGGASDMNHTGYATQPRRRVWRMNVELFVENLTAKTTCLGRSPGIRPGDVDAAFWASVSDPTSAL